MNDTDTIDVRFESKLPCSIEHLTDNVNHALSLGLPPADDKPIKTLTIVANGPSALQCPINGLTGPTLALNGALGLFLAQGKEPTYWCACDPGPEVIPNCLPDDPPKSTTYLVGSTCDPMVFFKLKDRDVRLWHIDTLPIAMPHRPIKTASSVTLMTLLLMQRLGFRHFEVYGWDACYDGLKHHASDPDLTEPDPDGWSLIIDEKPYYTKPNWAMEGQEALKLVQHGDFTINVHGGGLVAALLSLNLRRAITSVADSEN